MSMMMPLMKDYHIDSAGQLKIVVVPSLIVLQSILLHALVVVLVAIIDEDYRQHTDQLKITVVPSLIVLQSILPFLTVL